MRRLEKSSLHKLFPSPLSFIFLVSLKEEKGRIIRGEIEEARKEEGLKTLRLLQMYSFKSEKNFNLLIFYLLAKIGAFAAIFARSGSHLTSWGLKYVYSHRLKVI